MADRPRVFVTRRLPGDAVERLGREVDVDLWPGDVPPGNLTLRERAHEAGGIVCLLTDRIDAQLIAAAPNLRVISNVAVGYDNIDVAAATKRGIAVGNTPGVLTETTADLAFALMLAVARRIVEAERFVRDARWRTWDPNLLLGHDVHGATLGIVGFGKIGRAAARRAQGFGMRVLYATRSQPEEDVAGAERVEMERLLRESDFVSLHVPLTDETRHMIGGQQLRSMKPAAILINTARGPIVDQQALARALTEGWIGGAGLDVAEVEPIPPGDALMRAPNTVLLPHIASASHATRGRMADMAIDNVLAGVRGERLPNCVNPEVYG
ncbi:MAG: D-glycerate dehydrogenase [Dehalococcoidia bacterium]